MIDRAIGFGKTPEQSIRVIARLETSSGFGNTLLLGVSRKRFIDHVSPSGPADPHRRSLAAHLLRCSTGQHHPNHDVAETGQAIKVAMAIRCAK